MVKATLLKPLDGMAEGTEREFEQDDFNRLKAMGAVKEASGGGEKSAPPAENKAAPPVENKAAAPVDSKTIRTRS